MVTNWKYVVVAIFYPALLTSNVPKMYTKDENGTGTEDEDGRQCELFALFTHWLLGSEER